MFLVHRVVYRRHRCILTARSVSMNSRARLERSLLTVVLSLALLRLGFIAVWLPLVSYSFDMILFTISMKAYLSHPIISIHVCNDGLFVLVSDLSSAKLQNSSSTKLQSCKCIVIRHASRLWTWFSSMHFSYMGWNTHIGFEYMHCIWTVENASKKALDNGEFFKYADTPLLRHLKMVLHLHQF